MPLQTIGGRTVYALDSQVAGIAELCAWVEAHRDPTLEFWDQYDACMRQSYWDKRRHRQRKSALPVPGGLLAAAEVASKLGCSIKTLKGHVAAGALKYVAIGHGRKRPRKMFTAADLDEFIAAQTRKDVPCPSTSTSARRTINTTSSSEVIAFTALRRPRPGVKPKK
jgi:hypothetical protein